MVTAIRRVFHGSPASWLVAALLMLPGVPVALAQEGHHDTQGHEGEHSFHKNLIAGFIGITAEDRHETALTLGLDYERRLNESFGIGLGVEHSFGDLDFTVLTVPFALHFGPTKVFVAPGLEKSDHHGDEFLARVGVEYAFEVGHAELAPKLMLDFVDGETVVVFGLGIGKGF